MVNIGDLTVSLTIESGGNLDRLQKQLEAIVGPNGDSDVELTADLDPRLYNDVQFIKQKVQWLLPTAAKSQKDKAGFLIEMATLTKNVKEFREKMIDRLEEIDPKNLESLMEEWGLGENATNEDIRKAFSEYIDEMIAYLEFYLDREIVNNQTERVKTLIRNFLSSVNAKTGENLTLLRNIMKRIGENQVLWEKLFSEIGVLKKGQSMFFALKDKSIREIFEEQLKGEFDEEEFQKWKKETLEDLPSDEKVEKWTQKIIQENVKPAEIIYKLKEAGEDTEEAVKSFFKAWMEGKLKDLAIPKEEWDNFIADYMRKNKTGFSLTQWRHELKIDIELIKNRIPELEKIFSKEEVEKMLEKPFQELKQVFIKKDIEQMKQRKRYLGEMVGLITGMIPSGLKKEVEGLGVDITQLPGLRKTFNELKNIEALTQEQIDVIIQQKEVVSKAEEIVGQLQSYLDLQQEAQIEQPINRVLEMVTRILQQNENNENLIREIISKLEEEEMITAEQKATLIQESGLGE